jgi:two-component system response regulator RegX3
MHIGILEDESIQQELYKVWLTTAHHGCDCYDSGKAFIEALQRKRYDLLILDWVLPDSSGEIVLRWVRENLGWDVPVIFVTSRDVEEDVVKVLRQGADDYIVKPPKMLELLARIEALGRRSRPLSAPTLRMGNYEIRQDAREIYLGGEPVALTQKEFELATYMFQHPGKLLSRVHLLEKIWGKNANVDTRTVDTHVSRIRKKLRIAPENGWQIHPVYGYGYRIERLSESRK